MLFAKFFLIAVFFLSSFTCGLSENLTAREIIDRTIVKDRKMREQRTQYEYDYFLKTQKLTRANVVKDTRTIRAKLRPSKEISHTVEILEDSSKLSNSELKKEAKKMEKAQVMMTKVELEKLVDYYDFKLVDRISLKKTPVYLIRFTPRAGVVIRSKEEKVLSVLTGQLWIDQQTFALLQSEAKLTKPVAVAWVFATMRELNFKYTTTFLPSGEPVPATFDLFFDVQVALGYQRVKQASTMKNYRKAL